MAIKFPDEFIEYWGVVYEAVPAIHRRGIKFEVFLQDPHSILRHIAGDAGGREHLPLLPRQHDVMRRLDREDTLAVVEAEFESACDRMMEIHRRNGRYIEPLRHHAFPNRSMFRRVV